MRVGCGSPSWRWGWSGWRRTRGLAVWGRAFLGKGDTPVFKSVLQAGPVSVVPSWPRSGRLGGGGLEGNKKRDVVLVSGREGCRVTLVESWEEVGVGEYQVYGTRPV